MMRERSGCRLLIIPAGREPMNRATTNDQPECHSAYRSAFGIRRSPLGCNRRYQPMTKQTLRSYLLRLWRDHAEAPLRATLIAVELPDKPQHFATMDELFAFLIA